MLATVVVDHIVCRGGCFRSCTGRVQAPPLGEAEAYLNVHALLCLRRLNVTYMSTCVSREIT